MSLRIIWSPEAVADLTQIRAYVVRDLATYAAALIERRITSIEQLADFPRLGRTLPEFDDDSIRHRTVDRYRVRTHSVDLAAIGDRTL